MTRIHLSPLEQSDTALRPVGAVLTARPSFPFYVDQAAVVVPATSSWTFRPGHPDPVIELTEPIGYAWLLHLEVGSLRWKRTVVFVGEDLDWVDLTDVDPATLVARGEPIDTPTGRTLITREEVAIRLAALTPEVGGTDYTLLFENGLI